MRIRNLYNPPTMKDRAPVKPWTPSGMTAEAKTTGEGCEITVTGSGVSWLYPPEQDGFGEGRVGEGRRRHHDRHR